MRATVTSHGRVTIPKEIREQSHITFRTVLDFQITSEGILIVRALTRDIKKLKGIAKKKGQRPVPLKTLKQTYKPV